MKSLPRNHLILYLSLITIFFLFLAYPLLLAAQSHGNFPQRSIKNHPVALSIFVFLQFIAIIILFFNILKRKRIEVKLRESEEKFKSLVENATDYIMRINREGNILFINHTLAGIDKNGVIGKTVYDYIPDKHHDMVKTAVDYVFKESKPTKYTLEIIDPITDNVLWFESRVSPIIQKGKVTSALLVGTDYTEYKKILDALKGSEEKYRDLVEEMADVIYSLDIQGNIVSVNKPIKNMLNIDPQEVIGKSFAGVVCKDVLDEANEAFQKILAGQEITGETILVDKTGKQNYVEYSSTRVMKDGEVVGARGILRDISKRKAIEGERERLFSDLAAKNLELERFTYVVSHDLRSPLLTIRGFLGFLENDILKKKKTIIKKDIAQIHTAVDRMQLLLDELFRLSKLGKIGGSFQEVDLNEIAQKAVDIVSGQIVNKNVEIVMSDELPVIYGDPSRLVEVFQNLIENAVKYMGSTINPKIEIGIKMINGFNTVFIADNGMGIDAKFHEKIFDIFTRLNYAGEGSGMGLAIVKRVIELHKGNIWVESKGENKGTIFFIRFPDVDEVKKIYK